MKMILIQDGSQNTNVDKPLRIIGDPYKVQVSSQEAWTPEGFTVHPALPGYCQQQPPSKLPKPFSFLPWMNSPLKAFCSSTGCRCQEVGAVAAHLPVVTAQCGMFTASL